MTVGLRVLRTGEPAGGARPLAAVAAAGGRRAMALPGLAAGLVLAGVTLGPTAVGEARLLPPSTRMSTSATSATTDAVRPPFPPIRSRAIVRTGLGTRTLDIVVAIAWRDPIADDQAVRLVLRPVPRPMEPPADVVVRSVTIPVTRLTRAGAQLSLRAMIDVSALQRGNYGVYVQLPPRTGGAWASATRNLDERMIRIYSAPYPPPVAVCCPEW